MLVSAIHQHESVIVIHMSPPSWTSLWPPTPSHPSRLSQSTRFELPASYSKFPLAIYFTYVNVNVSVSLFLFIPPSPSPTAPTSLFSMSESPLLPCKYVHQYHLSRFYTCVNVQYLFFSFWLISLLIIGSRFIYLIKIQLCSFLWLNNIPLYICTTTFLSTHLSMDI